MADILTPALGESVTEATIAKWTKKVGDPVKKDELLVELETDKVSLEVVSPADGVLKEIKFDTGATVTSQQVIAVIEEGAVADALQIQVLAGVDEVRVANLRVGLPQRGPLPGGAQVACGDIP